MREYSFIHSIHNRAFILQPFRALTIQFRDTLRPTKTLELHYRNRPRTMLQYLAAPYLFQNVLLGFLTLHATFTHVGLLQGKMWMPVIERPTYYSNVD